MYKLTRRMVLKSLAGLAVSVPLVQACAPAGAPAAPIESKPEATKAPASAATAVPIATAAAPAEAAKVTLTYATYADPRMDWERVYGKQWAEKHPEVDLVIDEVLYAEMPKKQLAMLATNTLWDVSYSGVKWIQYPIYKGAFMPIDDLVAASNYDLSDFLQCTITNSSFEGKLYGLPYIVEAGNLGLVFFNVDMLEDKGFSVPTDDWSLEDFVEIAVKCTDPSTKTYGTDLIPEGFYDCALLARSWGGELMGDEGKQYLLNVDPKTRESIKWVVDLRAKHHCAPLREETEGLQFAGGNMAMHSSNTSFVKPVFSSVGDKFRHDVAMFPKGPTGLRGYDSWTETFSI
ncbi:MAG: extracellular solute-binding protein, partial [Chloroflexi bacterium]|nr:extracellular solute-binding protein [Chloroflexota bacterium]